MKVKNKLDIKDPCEITLIKDAVHNPTEPRHYMTLTELKGEFSARFKSLSFIHSNKVLKMSEVAHKIIDPVYYFPKESINLDYFEASSLETKCPLKGKAKYYHLKCNGERLENAAWIYHDIITPALKIKDWISFDTRFIRISINSEV